MNIPFLNFEPMHNEVHNELQAAFSEVLTSNWFVLGKHLSEFEDQYAKFNNVARVIGVSNGLDALHLALLSLGISEGDEVIVPSNTYIASVLAVSFVGAIPVLVEPNIDSYNIDVDRIEMAITPKTKAIMPVHLYGQACEMEAIMNIADKYGLFVVEDNKIKISTETIMGVINGDISSNSLIESGLIEYLELVARKLLPRLPMERRQSQRWIKSLARVISMWQRPKRRCLAASAST